MRHHFPAGSSGPHPTAIESRLPSVATAARLLALCGLALAAAGGAQAQPASCVLGSVPGKPNLQALQCGQELTVIAETAADVRVSEGGGVGQLSATVNSGAAQFQFRASARQPGFQILTPHAVAAVRGTTWAVDVRAANTALFVEEGAVAVDDHQRKGGVIVRRGQGVVAGGGEPLVAARWSPARIKALLSRLGR